MTIAAIVIGTALALLALLVLVLLYLAALLWMVEQCDRDREVAWG